MDLILTSKSDLRDLIDTSMREVMREHAGDAEHERKFEKDWLTNQEAQEYLGLSKSTLQRYRDSGLLQYSKVGNRVYYQWAELLRLLDSSSHSTGRAKQ